MRNTRKRLGHFLPSFVCDGAVHRHRRWEKACGHMGALISIAGSAFWLWVCAQNPHTMAHPGVRGTACRTHRLQGRHSAPYRPQRRTGPGPPHSLWLCGHFHPFFDKEPALNPSFRTSATVITLTIAALAAPSLAHAKRMGGGGRSVAPARIGKAPAAPVAPAAKAPATVAAPAATPATPAPAAAASTAAPAAAAAPARGPGLMGTMGAAAVGAVAGSMAGNALAGGTASDKDAKAKEAKAKEAEAAEKEAKELQRKADEAKAKAEAARAAAK